MKPPGMNKSPRRIPIPTHNYKLDDVLRVTNNRWPGYPAGSEGKVIEATDLEVWVEITKHPTDQTKIGARSQWWNFMYPTNRAKMLVVSQVTDEEVEATRQALQQLLNQF